MTRISGRLGAVMAALSLIIAVTAGAGAASAAKPDVVVQWSNGYPSGPHYNLNIHGKKADFECDPTPGGGSVFVPEYGTDEIDFVQNKRASLTELVAKDPCGATFDNDPVLVQLPAGEYQVYARILAKPSKDAAERSVIFYPKLVEACNDSGTDTFADAVDCDESFLMGTGVITSGGTFEVDEQSFTRSTGKSKAVDITAMFTWTGYACDQGVDTNGNGEIDTGDLPGDLDGDTDVDDDDLALYLLANCTSFEDEWVFNIADLVVYGWDYVNSGSKLLQVRFYPLSTTTFD